MRCLTNLVGITLHVSKYNFCISRKFRLPSQRPSCRHSVVLQIVCRNVGVGRSCGLFTLKLKLRDCWLATLWSCHPPWGVRYMSYGCFMIISLLFKYLKPFRISFLLSCHVQLTALASSKRMQEDVCCSSRRALRKKSIWFRRTNRNVHLFLVSCRVLLQKERYGRSPTWCTPDRSVVIILWWACGRTAS